MLQRQMRFVLEKREVQPQVLKMELIQLLTFGQMVKRLLLFQI